MKSCIPVNDVISSLPHLITKISRVIGQDSGCSSILDDGPT